MVLKKSDVPHKISARTKNLKARKAEEENETREEAIMKSSDICAKIVVTTQLASTVPQRISGETQHSCTWKKKDLRESKEFLELAQFVAETAVLNLCR